MPGDQRKHDESIRTVKGFLIASALAAAFWIVIIMIIIVIA